MKMLMLSCILLTLLGAHGQYTSAYTSAYVEYVDAPASVPPPGVIPDEQYVITIEEHCEANCVMEPFSGASVDDLPEFCEEDCPDYILPEEALDPNAVCTNCPEEDCEECLCSDGSCLDNTHVIGRRVDSFTCSSCRPRRKCRRFWWC